MRRIDNARPEYPIAPDSKAAVAAIVAYDRSDVGRYLAKVFRLVASHDSLEIRGSRHKSADLSAPTGTI